MSPAPRLRDGGLPESHEGPFVSSEKNLSCTKYSIFYLAPKQTSSLLHERRKAINSRADSHEKLWVKDCTIELSGELGMAYYNVRKFRAKLTFASLGIHKSRGTLRRSCTVYQRSMKTWLSGVSRNFRGRTLNLRRFRINSVLLTFNSVADLAENGPRLALATSEK